MASPKSCAILGHNPMRFAWGFDEEAAECHDIDDRLSTSIGRIEQKILYAFFQSIGQL